MSDNKMSKEDLKKLEDEAYFELCQIIAEAMQYQDIDLLNARIASWKNKYKKILDNPSPNFKKRIDYLLNQYYSEITLYISKLLAEKEKKKIENQAKAMRELYKMIKNTNDYDLLKKKVNKWKEKYPIDSFLRMYQKRIELYTRDKNLKENAFKQEEAFCDLVDITKKHATLDELNVMVEDWEKKYAINDKYSIDDFLKHQSEVKRFISDEFLQSIAREDRIIDSAEKSEIDVVSDNKSFSDRDVQATAYASLCAIPKGPNSVNEMFRWVYKNRHIKFNDKYKELILSATYLDYSPTYLNKLSKPDMDMSKSSLSFNEYQHISDIKRYAIISYFNLLLPPEKAISNDYFTKNVQIVYAKSEKARTTSKMEEDVSSLHVDDMLNSGIEVSLNKPTDVTLENTDIIEEIKDDNIVETSELIVDNDDTPQVQEQELKPKPEVNFVINSSKTEQVLDNDKAEHIENKSNYDNEELEKDNITQIIPDETTVEDNITDVVVQDKKLKAEPTIDSSKTEDTQFTSEAPKESINSEVNYSNDIQYNTTIGFDSEEEHIPDTDSEIDMSSSSLSIEPAEPKEEFDYCTVVALSPLFIAAVNNLDKQATIVDRIDSDVTEYVQKQKTQELELSTVSKTKSDI